MIVYIVFIITIILFLIEAYYYLYKKDKFNFLITIGSLIISGASYFQFYSELPWTHRIFAFAPVYYSASGYNEGEYYGEWEIEYPHGKGKITYKHFVDGKYNAIKDSQGEHKALYYEGYFNKGWREGQGKTVYEDGYIDEGIYYGKWESGKIVFEGQRYYSNGQCRQIRIEAQDSVNGRDIILE